MKSILSLKAIVIASAALIPQSKASASLFLDFNTDPLNMQPSGSSYINEPADTAIRVIDTSSGTPFPADFIRSLQMTDNSATASAAVAFRSPDQYSAGVASLDFALNNGYSNIRIGDGGTTGNLTVADKIAAQIVLQSATVGGLPMGRVSVSNISGALVQLDQTFALNSVYNLEVAFIAGGGSVNGTFQIFLTDDTGARTMLTSNSGSNSVFDFRGGANPLIVDTIRFQAGAGADVGASIAIDNIRLIPEPGAVSLAVGGLIAFTCSQWLRTKRSAASSH